MRKPTKKGVAGLNLFLGVVVMLFMIGLIVMVFSIAGNKIIPSIRSTETSSSVYQTGVNISASATGIILTECGNHDYGRINSISSVLNTSGGTIASTAYVISYPCNVVNSTANKLEEELVNITYSYTYSISQGAEDAMNDTIIAIGSSTDWFSTFIVLAALIVLILMVVLIVTSIRGTGYVGSSGSSDSTNSKDYSGMNKGPGESA